MKATGLCEGCPLCATGQHIPLCCPAVFMAWLNVDHVTVSGAVCMQTWVYALSCSALLSSHNQWPFSLRWWMNLQFSLPFSLSLCLSLHHPSFLALLVFLTMLPLLSSLYMLSPWRSTTYTAVSLCSVHVYFSWVQAYARVFACAVVWLPHFHQPLHDSPLPSHIVPVDRLSVVDVECCLWCVCSCVSSLQARVKNEILDYKDLAALPKVKAIYEVQQPDLISSSCQPYNRYTSDDRLDTYIYGEVFLWHTLSFNSIIVLFPL